MDGDYGSRTRLQTVWLSGACALLLVLLLGGGWLVLRGLSSTGTPSAAALAPSAISDTRPLAFGVPEFVDGVPWGFALDPSGAAAAGLVAVVVTGQPDVVFDPDRFGQVAAVVFTTDEASTQVRQVEAARTEFELSGWGQQPDSRRMYHLAPLTVRVTSFDADRPSAQVEVWAMTLVGVGDAGGAVFTTSTVELTADESTGTWRVTSLDSVEGPVPLVVDSPTAPGRTRALVREATSVLPLPLPDLTVVEPQP